MTWREDYAVEAMQDGRAAYHAGDDKNPHAAGSFEASAWNSGWGNAMNWNHQRSLLRMMFPPVKRGVGR